MEGALGKVSTGLGLGQMRGSNNRVLVGLQVTCVILWEETVINYGILKVVGGLLTVVERLSTVVQMRQ